MKTFEEKLEELSIIFSSTMKKFNDETTPPMLGILPKQIYFAAGFTNEEINIKEAS